MHTADPVSPSFFVLFIAPVLDHVIMPKLTLKTIKLHYRQQINNHPYDPGSIVSVDPLVANALVAQGNASHYTPPAPAPEPPSTSEPEPAPDLEPSNDPPKEVKVKAKAKVETGDGSKTETETQPETKPKPKTKRRSRKKASE